MKRSAWKLGLAGLLVFLFASIGHAGTLVWKGDAQAVAQVTTLTIGGTIEVGDLFTATVGSKTVRYSAATTVAATEATGFAAAWNAYTTTTGPEFAEVTAAATSGGALTLTADTAGVPFVVTQATTESNGGAADAQTFGTAATTASSGPKHWDTAANWSTGAVPVNSDDVVFQNSANDCLYGLDQNAVTLTSLTIDQSYTGKIGLPRNNAGGYTEYRDAYLKISATTITIGNGDGAGSGRIKLNVGTAQTTVNVQNSGTPVENGIKAILWKGTHASNVVNLNKGSFGAATFASETATIATLRQGFRINATSDTDCYLGSGCTLTTISKSGGSLEINSSVTTVTQTAGETVLAAGTPTTIHLNGGSLRYRSSGTCSTMNVSGAELDMRQDLRSKTISTLNLYKGAIVRDPFQVISSAAFILKFCSVSDVTLDVGTNLTLTRS